MQITSATVPRCQKQLTSRAAMLLWHHTVLKGSAVDFGRNGGDLGDDIQGIFQSIDPIPGNWRKWSRPWVRMSHQSIRWESHTTVNMCLILSTLGERVRLVLSKDITFSLRFKPQLLQVLLVSNDETEGNFCLLHRQDAHPFSYLPGTCRRTWSPGVFVPASYIQIEWNITSKDIRMPHWNHLLRHVSSFVATNFKHSEIDCVFRKGSSWMPNSSMHRTRSPQIALSYFKKATPPWTVEIRPKPLCTTHCACVFFSQIYGTSSVTYVTLTSEKIWWYVTYYQ